MDTPQVLEEDGAGVPLCQAAGPPSLFLLLLLSIIQTPPGPPDPPALTLGVWPCGQGPQEPRVTPGAPWPCLAAGPFLASQGPLESLSKVSAFLHSHTSGAVQCPILISAALAGASQGALRAPVPHANPGESPGVSLCVPQLWGQQGHAPHLPVTPSGAPSQALLQPLPCWVQVPAAPPGRLLPPEAPRELLWGGMWGRAVQGVSGARFGVLWHGVQLETNPAGRKPGSPGANPVFETQQQHILCSTERQNHRDWKKNPPRSWCPTCS